MSQRAAQILKEDMEVRGPVKVSEVEKAQQNIVKVARKLEEEGRIILAGRGGEELVV
jgi:flagellar motor switch protein FliG